MEGLDVPREGIDSVSHRQVFREEIRNAIREAIFSGKLNPGDRIIETYWAKELGVSRALYGRPSGIWRPWGWWRRCPSRDPGSGR